MTTTEIDLGQELIDLAKSIGKTIANAEPRGQQRWIEQVVDTRDYALRGSRADVSDRLKDAYRREAVYQNLVIDAYIAEKRDDLSGEMDRRSWSAFLKGESY